MSSVLHPDLRALQLAGVLRVKGHTVSAAVLDAEWKATDKAKAAAEARLSRAVRPVLLAAGERAAERMERATMTGKRSPAVDDAEVSRVLAFVFDADALLGDFLGVLEPAVLDVMRAGFATGLVRTSHRGSFDAERDSVRAVVDDLLGKAQSVPETLRGMVGTIVRDGLGSNLDTSEIAARIREAVPGLTQNQADLVSRTTGTAGFEAGQVEAFDDAGVEAKRWLTQRDALVRPEHATLDGEEVGIRETFSNGEDYPSGYNCRCTTLPVIRAKSHRPAARDRKGRPWLRERNEAIVRDYPGLRDAKGREVALDELGKEHGLSPDRIAAIWKSRPTS